MVNEFQSRSTNTLLIEQMLRDGVLSISEIARLHHVSRARVQFIAKRLQPPATPVAPHQLHPTPQLRSLGMRAINISFTPRVFAALTEACALVNQENSDDPITVEDYAEECVMNRLVTLGLLRKPR